MNINDLKIKVRSIPASEEDVEIKELCSNMTLYIPKSCDLVKKLFKTMSEYNGEQKCFLLIKEYYQLGFVEVNDSHFGYGTYADYDIIEKTEDFDSL